MGFMKNFGISIGIYFLLNAVFLFIFAAVGGVGNATIGEFFGLIGNDPWGFVTALFTLGGTQADVFNSALSYAVPNGLTIQANIVGILWVLVPGFVTAIFAGKISNESSKSAFFGLMIAIFVLTILPIIIVLIPAWTIPVETVIGQSIVPPMYYSSYLGVLIPWTTMRYVYVVLAGLFNGAFFGGLAAMFSTNF